MTPRPYLKKSVAELEGMYEENTGDLALLKRQMPNSNKEACLGQPVDAKPIRRRSFYLVTPSNIEQSDGARKFTNWVRSSFS